MALNSIMSSRIPNEKINIPEIIKGKEFLRDRVLSKRNKAIIVIKKDKAIAIPPRRGIFPEWIFLALTVSYKL